MSQHTNDFIPISILKTGQRLLSAGGCGAEDVKNECLRNNSVLDQLAICGGELRIANSTLRSIWHHNVSPEGSAVFYMALAMAIHYLGYSLARPTTLALFTSDKTGFTNRGAFPFAMAFVSPTSLLLLFLYGKELNSNGPRVALRHTTIYCAFALIFFSIAIKFIKEQNSSLQVGPFGILQVVVGILFVFRESYVQLLTSQMWSFMSSVLTPSQSSTWFAPISGLTSISSAAAGLYVSKFIESIGLLGVLEMSGAALFLSVLCSEKAYDIAIENGFNPEKENSPTGKKDTSHGKSIVVKARDVFSRVPTLAALFKEILACQGLSTVLNVLFVSKMKQEIKSDADRAGYMGKFYGLINIISCMLQFGLLPYVMHSIEPSILWKLMPCGMLFFCSFQNFQTSLSLKIVSACFLTMKILEFSVRRMLDEMVYVPLDYDSRYIGKEVISVFGYRFGKSGMSLILSAFTSLLPSFDIKELTQATTAMSLFWTASAFHLSAMVPSRADAEDAYRKMKATPK